MATTLPTVGHIDRRFPSSGAVRDGVIGMADELIDGRPGDHG